MKVAALDEGITLARLGEVLAVLGLDMKTFQYESGWAVEVSPKLGRTLTAFGDTFEAATIRAIKLYLEGCAETQGRLT